LQPSDYEARANHQRPSPGVAGRSHRYGTACASAVTVASGGPVPSMIAANVRDGMNASGDGRHLSPIHRHPTPKHAAQAHSNSPQASRIHQSLDKSRFIFRLLVAAAPSNHAVAAVTAGAPTETLLTDRASNLLRRPSAFYQSAHRPRCAEPKPCQVAFSDVSPFILGGRKAMHPRMIRLKHAPRYPSRLKLRRTGMKRSTKTRVLPFIVLSAIALTAIPGSAAVRGNVRGSAVRVPEVSAKCPTLEGYPDCHPDGRAPWSIYRNPPR
jgi:hypothetical protein